jgi:glutamate carboxypeptidase
VQLLRTLVTLESPSRDPVRLAVLADQLARELEARGAEVERHPAPGFGEHLLGRIRGERTRERSAARADEPPLLVLGHMDTVHAAGTLATLPFEADPGRDRVRGPGAYDMKGGIAAALAALDLLARARRLPGGDLLFLISCDEEIGSPSSRELIERSARGARAALVLEPCVPGGAAKTRRKGIAGFRLAVAGRAAHAGVEPEAGASAVHELIALLERVRALADDPSGTTVNVGVIGGGTRANVVAAHAEAEVDVRFWSAAEAQRVEEGIRALAPADPRCRLAVEGGVNRGALERTDASARLFAAAREIAAGQGWDLAEGATGGASDGNLTSAVGCPTLDGLGPDGGGAHSPDEHVKLSDLPRRIALLAGLFLEL